MTEYMRNDETAKLSIQISNQVFDKQHIQYQFVTDITIFEPFGSLNII